ncbi:GatB/YqeY domain-containing protein [Sansalvadorimonas sp. 2012CJ34-2]|uniref:GatB/YqeY domain-containing protein n=1 Tax=Parendozoicomonas callyspongiae TaxID=2942213 RepID=A0ABT0PF18_9GAMM|nr:GatB/YqeY domain-containing protein [Sansalvadorimonas sp. 2012CJ34-2]MCL6269973.1 GatB/YqeY domain-containing protein [Sansalvadorimonas sp. 2012CJ34-2]
MSANNLKHRLNEAKKDAMRAKDKDRLSVVRMALAEFKRVEVDERIEVDDSRGLALLDRMVKQRRESASQYAQAERHDLASKEEFEISVLQGFLPQPLTDDEINGLIESAITETGASSIKEMGQVMGILKPQVQGRADMGAVSKMLKAKLS